MKYRVGISGRITVEANDPFEAVITAMAQTIGQLGNETGSDVHVSIVPERQPRDDGPDDDE